MKRIIILPLLLIACFVQAQKGTNTYAISYGEGYGQLRSVIAMAKRFDSTSEGPVSFYDFNYNIGKRKHAALETGISLLKHDFTYRLWDSGSMSSTVSERSIYSLIVPLKLRTDILKYFFISGGFLAHLNIEDGGQKTLGIGSSLGIGLGAGIQYFHKEKYGVFIYPQVNVHSLGFGLMEQHTSFGISYRIHKN